MSDSWLHRKFAELDTAPLFDEVEVPRGQAREHKARATRVIDRVPCPGCGQQVSLYVLAMRENRRVLGIKRHYRTTYGGATLRCPRSETEIEIERG